jgi:hypothetical protein
MVMTLVGVCSQAVPSGGLAFTASTASLPPAPGRFSTTTCGA